MSTKLLTRVHGVASLEEAVWLESLGVDLLGVAVGEHSSKRVLDCEAARKIADKLTRARLCVEPCSGQLSLEELHRTGASLVAIAWGQEVSRTWREGLAGRGLDWVLVRVPADEDDDPSWIQARIVEAGGPEPAWVEVEICPNLEDGWSVIRDAHESELDAADLDELAATNRILYAPAFRPDNVRSIRDALPRARGFSLTLADAQGAVVGASQYSRDEIQQILQRLL